MAQDTLYFPHDYDPLRDPGLRMLVKKHGATGYAVFWRVVELLHQNSDHVLKFNNYIYEYIADELQLSSENVELVITDCVNGCKLLDANGDVFWSNRVFRNIEKRKSISEQRSKAGKASAEQRKIDREIAENSTNVQQPLTTVDICSTTVNKERKKEIYSI